MPTHVNPIISNVEDEIIPTNNEILKRYTRMSNIERYDHYHVQFNLVNGEKSLTTSEIEQITMYRLAIYPVVNNVTFSDSIGGSLSILPNRDLNYVNFLQFAGLRDKLWDHIKEKTEIRRKARYDKTTLNRTIMRPIGRPITKKESNFITYVNNLAKPIIVQDIKDFLAILIMMNIRQYQNMYSYFKSPKHCDEPIGCSFTLSRMTKFKFWHIMSCFDWDIDWVSKYFTQQTQRIYTPTVDLSTDKTMTPFCGRHCAHHCYIQGKPHPNGILSTSVGDQNKVLLSLKIRCRIKEDPKPLFLKIIFVHQLIEKIIQNYQEYLLMIWF